jgi:hypothetical protein
MPQARAQKTIIFDHLSKARSLNNCIRKVLAMARMVAPDKGIPEEVLDHAKSDRERSFLDMRFNGVPRLNKEIAAPCSPR